MPVSVKISDENYKRLSELSGELRMKLKKPVSLNEAISFLYSKGSLTDLSGAWIMNDKESDEIKYGLKKGWKTWKKSV
jgi:hypothetical protein